MAQVEDLKILLKVQDAGGTQVIEKLQRQLSVLQSAANKASKSGIDEVARSVRGLSTSGKTNIETLRGQITAMKALREQAVIGSTQFKTLTADINKYSAALTKAEGKRAGGGRIAGLAKGAGAIAAGGVFGGPEGAIGGAAGLVLGGPPGAAVGAAIGAQVGMLRQQLGGLAEYSADLAKQRLALKLVTKDAGEYQRALTFISQTSEQLAIPQDILTRQFTKLSASVIGAGGSVQDAETAFIGVASGIRGTGGSLQDLESALVATSQVFSKGKVSAEELRQQIGERLPGAFTLFAASLDMTPAQLDKALEKGQVSLQDFQKFAVKLFKEYGVSAQVLADSPMAAGDRLTTALANMSDSVGALLAPIGAAFQSTFADIANAIAGAAKAFNDFFGITGAPKMARLTEAIQREVKNLTELDKTREEILGRKTLLGKTPDLTFLDRDIRQAQARLQRLTDEYYSLQKIDIATQADGPKPKTGLPDVDRTKAGDTSGGTRKRLPASQKLIELTKILAERAGKVGEEELATLRYMIARQEILDNNLLPATDKEARLNKALAKFREDIAKAQERETKELEKQLKIKQKFNQELADRKYELGLIGEEEYNQLLVDRERQRLRAAYPGLGENQIEEMADLKRQQIAPTLAEGLQQNIAQLKRELKDLANPINVIVGGAKAIGGAFKTSFMNVITGSQTAKEALADFFKNVGNYFLDLASQLISKMVVIAALNAIAQILPVAGASGKSAPGPNIQSGEPFNLKGQISTGMSLAAEGAYWPGGFNAFANGGVVSKPTLGLVGEGGEPEYIIPASKMRGAMKRYSAGARGSGVIPANGEQGAPTLGGAGVEGGPIDVRYTVERINSVDYVTADQFRTGMSEAAQRGAVQGEQRTLRRLQMSTSTRKRLGM